jgi:glycosyltransferase involved in cell wall biosynthesis
MSQVGILMPCRGRLEQVQQAVQSILDQTYPHFDFLIIDDASDAPVADYLKSLKDRRVQVIHHEQPAGISACLNEGLNILETEWVFRMDADDIASPYRLEKQLSFLQRNPGIALLGAQISFFPGRHKFRPVPLTHGEIAYRLNWSNAFNHPTVCYRREEVLKYGGYNESLAIAQDYDLWTRLIMHLQAANLTECLLKYRHHPNQISRCSQNFPRRVREQIQIRKEYRLKLTGILVAEKFDLPDKWDSEYLPTREEWENWENYLLKLKTIFTSTPKNFSCDPGRDLARRYLKSAAYFQKAGGRCPNLKRVAKSLNRWYALSKGII